VSAKNPVDLSELSMIELLQLEVENQGLVLTENLLALEQNPTDASRLETLMRAAHSLKGAARMVDRNDVVGVAHELEDVFVAAQKGSLVLVPEHVDVLLRGVDLLHRIAQASDDDVGTAKSERATSVQQFLMDLAKLRLDEPPEAKIEISRSPAAEGADFWDAVTNTPGDGASITAQVPAAITTEVAATVNVASNEGDEKKQKHQRFLRVTPENLNRLLALTGESLANGQWLRFDP